jgi:hypothetical protein
MFTNEPYADNIFKEAIFVKSKRTDIWDQNQMKQRKEQPGQRGLS